MTPEEFGELLKDFTEQFCMMFLKIRTKQSEIKPFRFNNPQKKIFAVYKQAREAGKPLRFILLKARQEGASTFFEALLFFRTITNFHRKNLIVGHESKSATNLFEMCNRFYNNLPEEMKPAIAYSNEKKLSFSALDSEVSVASAEVGGKLQRSDTLNDVHLTEVAWWRDAKASLTALMQTVGSDPNKLVAVESTGNGIGGEFYNMWQDAKSGKNEFIPIFIAWFELPEYSKAFTNVQEQERFASSLSDLEKELIRVHSLSLEQMNWRRWAIENLCQGDPEQFKQEYPATDTEAFLVSGRPVFDNEYIYSKIVGLKDVHPFRIGELIYTDEKKEFVEFVDNKHGYLKLFYDYEHDERDRNRFVAGCDVAEGLEQGDRSIMKFLDRKKMKVFLTWAGMIHPDLLAEEQHKIHLFLDKDVYFCTERNNHGLTTLVESNRLGVNNYYQEVFETGHAVTTDRIGFKTSEATKPQVINALNQAMRQRLIEDSEIDYWQECATFVRNSRGQMQAQGKDKDPGTKCFDDRVIAQALMWLCHQWMPQYESLKPKVRGWVSEQLRHQDSQGAGFRVGEG